MAIARLPQLRVLNISCEPSQCVESWAENNESDKEFDCSKWIWYSSVEPIPIVEDYDDSNDFPRDDAFNDLVSVFANMHRLETFHLNWESNYSNKQLGLIPALSFAPVLKEVSISGCQTGIPAASFALLSSRIPTFVHLSINDVIITNNSA